MEREDFIRTLTGIAPLTKKAVQDAVAEILALVYPYQPFVEGEFRFEDFPDLDEKVNAILRGLSDKGMEIMRQRMRDAIALLGGDYESYEDIVTEIENEGDGVLWAFDLHSSNLKRLLEGWITVAFAQKIILPNLLPVVVGSMDAPQDAPLWKEGIREHLIDPNEYRFGKGYQRNIPNAMKVLIVYVVTKVFMRSQQRMERLNGAAYYIRRRGSRYDCPECDALCGYPIPIDVPFEPTHPNCVCWAEYHYPEE